MQRTSKRRGRPIISSPADIRSTQKSSIYSIGAGFSKIWQSTPNIAKLALYGLSAYGAARGIIRNENEGFINDVVYIPIIEELLYRGILLEGIKGVQHFYNYIHKKEELTDTQIKTQQQFRIHIVAGLFAASHLDFSIAEMAFCYYHFGRATGYLKEKTGAFFAPIALHMAHNLLMEIRNRCFSPLTLSTALLTSSYFLYVPVLIALNKKILPVPNILIPNFATNTTAKIKDFFSSKLKTQNA
ncbi:MAG: hypothetical protein K1060chlam3_00862 [Candidatus Anoxychlamydiales bacterium]|nr:hypothetical protein [Candidatus Anoxychlamydiales bacterium]